MTLTVWTFTAVAIAIALTSLLFVLFQYFNQRGGPKKFVVKKSLIWGGGSTAALYILGLFFWTTFNDLSQGENEILDILKSTTSNDLSQGEREILDILKSHGIYSSEEQLAQKYPLGFVFLRVSNGEVKYTISGSSKLHENFETNWNNVKLWKLTKTTVSFWGPDITYRKTGSGIIQPMFEFSRSVGSVQKLNSDRPIFYLFRSS